MSTSPFDAVSLGIMWDRLVSLTDEIVSTLVRTSFSTIVYESYDLSCVVLDAEANSIAQGTFSDAGVHRQRARHRCATC